MFISDTDNFPNRIVDENTKKFINKKNFKKTKIYVFYKNGNYKVKERNIKNIVMNNIKCKIFEQLNINFLL